MDYATPQPQRPIFFSRSINVTLAILIAGNAIIWLIALLVLHHYAIAVGTAGLAYTLGLAHALDADHISAIDNVTRRLMQDGHRPTAVGFFFSLGHSTIVILLSLAITLTAASIQSHFPQFERYGGLIGTAISAAFLLLVAGVNLLILRTIIRTFLAVRRGEQFAEQSLDEVLTDLGWIGRVCRPIVRMVNRSWKMYIVGFLFGLGFDTATQVGLLGISAAAATQKFPIWSILIFPLLFTAGMCLVDTIDGILMLGAYGWAYVHPIRKLYYNMTITAISVLMAVFVGGLEILNMIGDQLDLHGWVWERIGAMGDHFGAIGISIVALFVVSWVASAVIYRRMGYAELEYAR
ncbi:MAG: HoxN/HupN/NixA family nickel/cobalt transporter [Phycisphaerae bacterium]|nr:HoxN/HupN/NixA family nickel/cobalt transporter [Phycisphaerae bacterium]